MGNDLQPQPSLAYHNSKQRKQSKLWRIPSIKASSSILQRETEDNQSPTTSSTSYNVYAPRKLQQIESDFNKIRQKFNNKAKSKQHDTTTHPSSSKQRFVTHSHALLLLSVYKTKQSGFGDTIRLRNDECFQNNPWNNT